MTISVDMSRQFEGDTTKTISIEGVKRIEKSNSKDLSFFNEANEEIGFFPGGTYDCFYQGEPQ